MNLSPNFTLEEMVFSQTAKRLGLDNTPNSETVHNLTRLCGYMEHVRSLLGNKAIVVSSGYRSPSVNAAIGGAPTSMHQYGLAIDFTCPSFGSPFNVATYLAKFKLPWVDQMIYEYRSWVHLGVAFENKAPRNQYLSIVEGMRVS